MSYRVELAPGVLKDLKKLELDVRKRIGKKLRDLEKDPRPSGCEKLSGAENVWRVRVGDYRILYEIHDQKLLVYVLGAGDRKEVYKEAGNQRLGHPPDRARRLGRVLTTPAPCGPRAHP